MGIGSDTISDLAARTPRAADPGPFPSAAPSDDPRPSFADHLHASDRAASDAKEPNASDTSNAEPPRHDRPAHERPSDAPAHADQPRRRAAAERVATGKAQSTPENTPPTPVTAPASKTPVAAPTLLSQLFASLATAQEGAQAEPSEVTPDAATTTEEAAAAPVTLLTAKADQTQAKAHAKTHGAAKTNGHGKHVQANATPLAPGAVASVPTATPSAAKSLPPAQQVSLEEKLSDPKPPSTDAPEAVALAPVATQAPTLNAPRTPSRDHAIDASGARSAQAQPVDPKARDIKSDSAAKTAAPKFIPAHATQGAPDKGAQLPPQQASVDTRAPASDAMPTSSPPTSGNAHPLNATTDATASAVRAAPVAAQIGREIIRRSNSGSTRFEMRLDPPELGRIDVRLDISRDHKVTAVISADNPQALSELSRGSRDLQQALQSAGLDLTDEGLSFDLSNSQGGSAQSDRSDTAPRTAPTEQNPASAAPETAPATRPLILDRWRGSRVDLVA